MALPEREQPRGLPCPPPGDPPEKGRNLSVLRLLRWQAVGCLTPRGRPQTSWAADMVPPAALECPLSDPLPAGRPASECLPGPEAHRRARRGSQLLGSLRSAPHSQVCSPPHRLCQGSRTSPRGPGHDGLQGPGRPRQPLSVRRLPRGCPELQGPQQPSRPLRRLPALAVLTANVAGTA